MGRYRMLLYSSAGELEQAFLLGHCLCSTQGHNRLPDWEVAVSGNYQDIDMMQPCQ